MRCVFVFTVFLLVSFSIDAQKKDKKSDDEYTVFTKVETDAVTDYKTWLAYLKKAAVLPDSVAAGIPKGLYKVNVQFIVDTYGNIAAVKATSNPGYGLAKKAETIILHHEGIWRPANQCGRAVKSYKEQVIQFVIGN
jgi:hypothetical protein